jgi:hypothetical protein
MGKFPQTPRAFLSWFLLTHRSGKKKKGIQPVLFFPLPTHAKSHAKKAWQMFMFKWGLHPQTPEPSIGRAMLIKSLQKITSNPSITRPIEGRIGDAQSTHQ